MPFPAEFRLECSAPVCGKATFSPCGRYRYVLTRRWAARDLDVTDRVVNWIMLNPSTADAAKDDATIRRCLAFSRAWGFDALVVTNLYALRSTDPSALLLAKDPIGPENDGHLLDCAKSATMVVCGWGNYGTFDRRGHLVRQRLADAGVRLHCLRITRQGEPEHPLYLPGTLRPTVLDREVGNG